MASDGTAASWRIAELRMRRILRIRRYTMFAELMPLLKQRVLMLTISRVDDELILVNVIPTKLDKEHDENSALTLPLSFTGKPEELDQELPGQLAAYTESVIKTGSNLEDLKTQ